MGSLEAVVRRVGYKYLNEFTKDEKIILGAILVKPKTNYETNFDDKNTNTFIGKVIYDSKKV